MPFQPHRRLQRLASALPLALLLGLSLAPMPVGEAATEDIAAPYRMIVLLDVTFPKSRGTCTGFLVATRTVATAAHCLYDADADEWATSVGVMPGVDGVVAPFARQIATTFSVSPEYLATGNPSYDYGAITLSSDGLGSAAGQFDLGLATDVHLSGAAFETAGYGATVRWGTLWRMGTKRPLMTFDRTTVVYEWGIAPGMSGAPIFEPNGAGYRAIGMATGLALSDGRHEIGVRTNERMLAFYREVGAGPSEPSRPEPAPVIAFTTARGRSVVVQSSTSAAASSPIVLQSSSDRVRWHTVAAGMTDSTGAARFTIWPTQTMYYRFVALGVGAGPISRGVVIGSTPATP